MAFFELNDIKRDRIPYSQDVYWKLPLWSPEIINTPLMNLKRSTVGALCATALVEPYRHFKSSINSLNYIYELPKNNKQTMIYLKETFKTPFFWSDFRKKMIYGAFQHTFDAGFKIAMFQYTFGATYSPITQADFNTPKYLLFAMIAGFAGSVTHYPLEVARRAYWADQSFEPELRKGYRSPLHALLKIPFTEGPMYLFRGGLLPYCGSSLNLFGIYFFYKWLKDKLFFFWEHNDMSYNFCKFSMMNVSFGFGALFGQPFYAVQNIIDKGPLERGGRIKFNSTWEGCKFVWNYFDKYNSNLMHGYAEWFRQFGLIFYITMWIADDMGLMNNNLVDPHNQKTTVSREALAD